jgi:hypothetical protein
MFVQVLHNTGILRENHVYTVACPMCEVLELDESYDEYLRSHDEYGTVRH